jgi:protease II
MERGRRRKRAREGTRERKETIPESIGGVYYFIRWDKGDEKSVWIEEERGARRNEEKRGGTRRDSKLIQVEGREEVLIDQNHTDVSVIKVSTDHELLAWTEDMDNNEKFRLKIKNIRTGKLLV